MGMDAFLLISTLPWFYQTLIHLSCPVASLGKVSHSERGAESLTSARIVGF